MACMTLDQYDAETGVGGDGNRDRPDMAHLIEELRRAGVLHEGMRVRRWGDKIVVTDGSFPEAELVPHAVY